MKFRHFKYASYDKKFTLTREPAGARAPPGVRKPRRVKALRDFAPGDANSAFVKEHKPMVNNERCGAGDIF